MDFHFPKAREPREVGNHNQLIEAEPTDERTSVVGELQLSALRDSGRFSFFLCSFVSQREVSQFQITVVHSRRRCVHHGRCVVLVFTQRVVVNPQTQIVVIAGLSNGPPGPRLALLHVLLRHAGLEKRRFGRLACIVPSALYLSIRLCAPGGIRSALSH